MKKILFLIPLFFLSINIVNADTIVATSFYDKFNDIYTDYLQYENKINQMITYWENNYSTTYPYYFVTADSDNYPNDHTYQYRKFHLYYGTSPVVFTSDTLSTTFGSLIANTTWAQCSGYQTYNEIVYRTDTDNFAYYNASSCTSYSGTNDADAPFVYLNYSNQSSSIGSGLYLIKSNGAVYSPTDNFSNISVPSYSDNNFNINAFTINFGDPFPSVVSLADGSYSGNGTSANYTEINILNYNYIILSLRDYTQSALNTNIYTLGSLCLTPVFNYGMTERKDILGTDVKVQACTEAYNTFTPVPVYINSTSISNHVVYYIVPQEGASVNKVRINTDIFNISYVDNTNVNNPTVLIGGRSYPVIPYSNLTDTANISTDEGYISGEVCSLGDIDCTYRTVGLDISDLWTQPLRVLQSVWSSITSVFYVITEFIILIPSPLKEFLISAFFLSVILGIIKIIV